MMDKESHNWIELSSTDPIFDGYDPNGIWTKCAICGVERCMDPADEEFPEVTISWFYGPEMLDGPESCEVHQIRVILNS